MIRRREIPIMALATFLLAGAWYWHARADRDAQYNAALESRNYRSLEDDTVRGQFVQAWRLQQAGEETEARDVYDAILHRASPELGRDIRYNLANLNLVQASRALADQDRGNDDFAFPLLELAKQLYRDILTEVPDAWNAKHNLEVAIRLAPDTELGGIPEDILPERSPESHGVIEKYKALP